MSEQAPLDVLVALPAPAEPPEPVQQPAAEPEPGPPQVEQPPEVTIAFYYISVMFPTRSLFLISLVTVGAVGPVCCSRLYFGRWHISAFGILVGVN